MRCQSNINILPYSKVEFYHYVLNHKFYITSGFLGKQSLWATAVMVQGTYGPLPSRYGPLQLWSSTHMGHILNGLGVHIEAVIGFKVGIGLRVGVSAEVSDWLIVITSILPHLLTRSRGEYLRVVGIHSDG